ncbi:Crp/Fnr family transcriptional regulator [Mesorhizobium sp. VK4C]|uniref:Crp/Fnr family transcriptional regulator n=1 Tax=Mesorhizobium captivum TaxID=3072319 RepID=UPI002A24D283|nr:Crp/Fnr family transcriptional regulator [Mesorhizobium sp. VK4C]MDX8498990.1 Crp/Fnr family transcriptional regulator [Mesorhizobium sp. VK4C]
MTLPTRVPSEANARRPEPRPALPSQVLLPGDQALFLSESVEGLDEGAHFLDTLNPDELARLNSHGRRLAFSTGEAIFSQGDRHGGIFIIESGQVRVFYTAPSGREITLAYWTAGHFIGGPEMTGGGAHIWSGEALSDCQILFLPASALKRLVAELPGFALCLVQGLAAKGRCYSAMAQMLGTRSVIERLAQFLMNLAELHGVRDGHAVIINAKVTHDQIAAMVGSTRQWVTMMMKRFQKDGLVTVTPRQIRIERPHKLMNMVSKDGVSHRPSTVLAEPRQGPAHRLADVGVGIGDVIHQRLA